MPLKHNGNAEQLKVFHISEKIFVNPEGHNRSIRRHSSSIDLKVLINAFVTCKRLRN